ncbi:MAG: hypothetical protein LRY76_06590 [Alphaproteobacteria bacterium]|nr:hypothetical protein [Alphaproteobacteria bacterium]MCD8571174.1 hypothetical protein [Alphaproteobacteria bacterium]
MRRSSKLLLTATLAISAGFGAKEGYKHWKRYQTQKIYAEILTFTGVKNAQNFDEQMDVLRIFVNTNSAHKIDAEFKSYWRDPAEIGRRMLPIAKGESDKKLHLECSTRSGMMGSFTKIMGYRTRSVSVYGVLDGLLLSHTFIEIQNPETEKWQVQDPDLDLYYTVNASGERASAEDLIRNEIEDITPCNSSGACGWDIVSPEDFPATKMHKYMGLASINDYQVKDRPLLVNTKRFDLSTPVTYRKTDAPYCRHLEKNCRDEIVKF